MKLHQVVEVKFHSITIDLKLFYLFSRLHLALLILALLILVLLILVLLIPALMIPLWQGRWLTPVVPFKEKFPKFSH